MTSYDKDFLRRAHVATSDHRKQLEASELCGCFYCKKTFAPVEIDRWLNEGSGTAFCPRCGIDSVMGDASGFPIAEPGFLSAMNRHWF